MLTKELPVPPFIEAFFDKATNTISYLVGDPATRTAAVINPVLDFDLASGRRGHALGRPDRRLRT